MQDRGFYESVSTNASSLIESFKIISGTVVSLIFRKKDEVVTINYKGGDYAVHEYRATVEQLALETLQQTNARCRGKPYQVITAHDAEYYALGLHGLRLPNQARLDLLPCDALSRQELDNMVRSLANPSNSLVNIIQRKIPELLGTSAPRNQMISVVLPSPKIFLAQDDAFMLSVHLNLWHHVLDKNLTVRFQENMQKVSAYIEGLKLKNDALRSQADAERIQLNNVMYHTALRSAGISVFLTSVREMAVLSGTRQAQADYLIDMLGAIYFTATSDLTQSLIFSALNRLTNRLSDKFIDNTNAKFAVKLVAMLSFESLFSPSKSFEEVLYTSIIRNLSSVTAYFATRQIIHSGYQYFFGSNKVVTLQSQEPEDVIIDGAKKVSSVMLSRNYTVAEVARNLLDLVNKNHIHAATQLLEEIAKTGKENVALILGYAHTDLEHMPTTLILMCKRANVSMVSLLLRFQTELDYEYDEGTALLLAVRAGSLDITKALIAKGASTACLDPDDNGSLLHIAAENNCVNILKYFRQKHRSMVFDLDALNKHFHTPLEVAKSRNHLEAATIIAAMAKDVLLRKQKARRMDLMQQVEHAGFSVQSSRCFWKEIDNTAGLVVPCENSVQLSAFLDHLGIIVHAAAESKIVITEEDVNRLLTRLAKDDSLWLDYGALTTGMHRLLAAANYHYEISYNKKVSRFAMNDSGAVALISSIVQSDCLSIQERSCEINLHALTELSSEVRKGFIVRLNAKAMQYQHARDQFIAIWHGVTTKEVRKIKQGDIFLSLKPKKVALLSALLSYFKFVKTDNGQYKLSVEHLLLKCDQPLPRTLVKYLNDCDIGLKLFLREARRHGDITEVCGEQSFSLLFDNSRSLQAFHSVCVMANVAVTLVDPCRLSCTYKTAFACSEDTFTPRVAEVKKSGPASLQATSVKRIAKPLHKASATPAVKELQSLSPNKCSFDTFKLFTDVRQDIERVTAKHRALLFTNVYDEALLYEITFLAGVQLWFSALPEESQLEPLVLQIRLESTRLAVTRFLTAIYWRISRVSPSVHLSENDKLVYDLRMNIAEYFIPAEELECFIMTLFQENLLAPLECLVLGYASDHPVLLQHHASFFNRPRPVDPCQRVDELMAKLAGFIQHYDDKTNPELVVQIKTALLTADFPEEQDVNTLTHEVRAMYACLVSLAEIAIHHSDKLKRLSGGKRHFLSVCAEMCKFSKDFLLDDQSVSFDPLSLPMILENARQGAELWKKEKNDQRASSDNALTKN